VPHEFRIVVVLQILCIVCQLELWSSKMMLKDHSLLERVKEFVPVHLLVSW